VEPEYQLPNCYTVVNTQPVHSKIGSFSDETLFYIFYTMPRDIMQEVVVAELFGPLPQRLVVGKRVGY